jgi:multidrug efflux pump subunit AcrA (membrane-fusion protein)
VKRAGKDVEVFPVEAELAKADPRIKPGMTGDVHISVREEPHVLALPLESVQKKDGNNFVTRVVSDATGEHTERVQVRLGDGNDHVVEIVSGIHEGQRVLIDPASSKKNETKI